MTKAILRGVAFVPYELPIDEGYLPVTVVTS
jgi:hypothetical protein